MASKYDQYWTSHLAQIRDGIRVAASNGLAEIALNGLRSEGDRQSWYGTAEVRGRSVVRSSMAHATSLATMVARTGTCEQWPEQTIRFSVNATGDILTISAGIPGPGSTPPKRIPSGTTAPRPIASRSARPSDVPPSRQSDTEEFYAIFGELAESVGGPKLLRDYSGDSGWPSHGVYFFFEDGEIRADGNPRVVRVGTHALTETSQTTLWNRLRQHRGHLTGRHPGGGNHRASVFRRHVGAALIRSEGLSDDLLRSWLDRHNPSAELAALEAPVEIEVSRRIGAMPFLWLNVPERADRMRIERDSIALLSRRSGEGDVPSPGWLGHHAVRSQIRDSGLWNVEHVDTAYDAGFLARLAELAGRTSYFDLKKSAG